MKYSLHNFIFFTVTCFGGRNHLQAEHKSVCVCGVCVCVCVCVCALTSFKTAPHNRYQPHPAEPEKYTKYSNRSFVLLKMGIMMPETC